MTAACLLVGLVEIVHSPVFALLGGLLLLLLAALWWARPSGPTDGRLGRLLLPVGGLLLLASGLGLGKGPLTSGDLRERAETGYRQAWSELDRASSAVASSLVDVVTELGGEETVDGPRLPTDGRAGSSLYHPLFAQLRLGVLELEAGLDGAPDRSAIGVRGHEAASGPAVLTVILLDPDGEATAWHGPGILHEPEGYELAPEGRFHRRSHTAVTLGSISPVGEGRRPWRVVVARSYAYDVFPFLGDPEPPLLRWSVAEAQTSEVSGLWRLGETPFLYLEPPGVSIPGSPLGGNGGPHSEREVIGDEEFDSRARAVSLARAFGNPRGLALLLIVFASLVEGVHWLFSLRTGRLTPDTVLASTWGSLIAAAPMIVGLIVAAHVTHAGASATLALAFATLAFAASFRQPRRASERHPVAHGTLMAGLILRSALAVAVVLALTWLYRVELPALGPHQGQDPSASQLELAGLSEDFEAGSEDRGLDKEVLGEGEEIYPAEVRSTSRYWSKLAVGLAALAGLLFVPGPTVKAWGYELQLSLIAGLTACALPDTPAVALVLLLLMVGAAGLWWQGLATPPGLGTKLTPQSLGILTLLACLLGMSVWHIVDREILRQQLGEDYLPELQPPSPDELNSMLVELDRAFSAAAVTEVLPPPTAAPTDPKDLAFALWRRSPLSRRDGLSALVVKTRDGRRSTFAFGLAVDDQGVPLPEPARWPIPLSAPWREGLIEGESLLGLVDSGSDGLGGSSVQSPVRSSEGPWGSVRYWFLPRPGFRIAVDENEELERNLVRGKPRQETADGLPRGVRYGLFDLDGRALSSPWDESPPLPQELLTADLLSSKLLASRDNEAPTESHPAAARLDTPDGPSWVWLDGGIDGIEALFLPILSPRAALERVGFDVVVLLAVLLALTGLGWLTSSTRASLGAALRSAFRSYSKRLILVYTVLLLLPMIALNLVLMRSFSARLGEDQLDQAQSAMVSARQLLLDYLQGLEPGFLIETKVNRELLEWIGGLVQHQVNLYWGSRLYASSQQELFTAGLLPERIPAEIYSRLTLLGYDMGFRRQRTGQLAYLEVYAPFDAPGIVSSQQGLFLSVPLLEQEEEAGRQLALLQKRAILVTTALFLLLLGVGGRLAEGFTRPIVQLIRGTRRIARGEAFGPVRPRETELLALADAISAMADEVQESRQKLMGEKRFIERVVANINSAVVSLDRDNRVVFQNDLAAKRLGTKTGVGIYWALAKNPALAPIETFLRSGPAAEGVRSAQVKLRPRGEKVEVLEWTLTWVPIPGDADPGALLVVDDATEVLRGQRLEAWAEMARIIAHEIKNPLTPIQLSTEHLRQVWLNDRDRLDEVVDRCTSNILTNVEELRSIASEFSIYSRIPASNLEVGDLVEPVRRLVSTYQHAPDTSMTFVSDADEVFARFDTKLLGRALRNLLENALRAAGEGGSVEVSVTQKDGNARLQVADSGPGVDPQKLNRIFEPYFSTYEKGTGLGLAITRRIVDEHAGTIEARNRPGGGLAVLITMPAMESPA